MKGFAILPLLCLASTTHSLAQSETLGAHLNYGRGCTACHVSYSASVFNDNASPSSTALWGDDVTSSYDEIFSPNRDAKSPEAEGILWCLGCHDGNLAPIER
jgi:hypothetical protein